MRSFRDYLNGKLENKKFALEYEKASDELDFALSLVRRREELELTQHDLAELTGIKQPMIARIEKGQIPTVPTLHRIAEALLARIVITGTKIVLEEDAAANYVNTALRMYSGECIHDEYMAGSLIRSTAVLRDIYDVDMVVFTCLNADETNVQAHLDILDAAKDWGISSLENPPSQPQIIIEVKNGESRVKEFATVCETKTESFGERDFGLKQREEAANAELALAA